MYEKNAACIKLKNPHNPMEIIDSYKFLVYRLYALNQETGKSPGAPAAIRPYFLYNILNHRAQWLAPAWHLTAPFYSSVLQPLVRLVQGSSKFGWRRITRDVTLNNIIMPGFIIAGIKRINTNRYFIFLLIISEILFIYG